MQKVIIYSSTGEKIQEIEAVEACGFDNGLTTIETEYKYISVSGAIVIHEEGK